jgi:hemoglobin
MKDIRNREDIELLINHFYEKIGNNKLLGPIFNHIANVDWGHHLPKMYDFWNMALFDVPGYEGHPLKPHLVLNSHHQIGHNHFETWLKLFNETVDEHFVGEKATEIKLRAKGIGETWAHKIDYLNKLV